MGTENPYFTTDSCGGSPRERDPGRGDPQGHARRRDLLGRPEEEPFGRAPAARLTYQEVLEKRLAVMDATFIALCRDNRMPIRVFNLLVPGNIRRVVMGEPVGSLVDAGRA